jgi:three-Cys-motif partner protein
VARPSHLFGSDATDLKLDVVRAYLKQFTTALRPQFDELVYIDVFSGSGAREVLHEAQPANLIDDAREEWIEERRGSARIALENDPPFTELVFIEKKRAFCRALEALARDEYPGRKVRVLRGEANEQVLKAIARRNWVRARAVMFIDPYGMQLNWSTLEAIRQTQAIDIWYLVTLQGIYRQATNNRQEITPKKREALNRMLGTDEWEVEWYTPKSLGTLLDTIEERSVLSDARIANVDEMQNYVGRRLASLFPYVSPKPLRLKTKGGAPGFALFFACSNPKRTAFGLASRIADHILKLGNESQVRPRN